MNKDYLLLVTYHLASTLMMDNPNQCFAQPVIQLPPLVCYSGQADENLLAFIQQFVPMTATTNWPECIIVQYAQSHLKGAAAELRDSWENFPMTIKELFTRLEERFAADAKRNVAIQFNDAVKNLVHSNQVLEDFCRCQKLARMAQIPEFTAIPIIIASLPVELRVILSSHRFDK